MVLDKNNKKVLTIRSNGLTQTDRDYFNIVKTEDGVSDFFRVDRNQEKIRLRKRENNFLYHSVRGEEGEKVAAIYLPNVTWFCWQRIDCMERHMTHFVQFSYFMMIPTVFTASKGLEIFYSDIYCEYFRPLDRIKHWQEN